MPIFPIRLSMKYLWLISILLVSCSIFLDPQRPERKLAGLQSGDTKLVVGLTDKLIFANGVNTTTLQISALDEQAQLISINPAEVEIISDVGLEAKVSAHKGKLIAVLRVPVKSPDIKIYVKWRDVLSELVQIETTLYPIKNQLTPLPFAPTTSQFISGMYYTRQDNGKEGQYESFQIENRGPNGIVSAKDSIRSFEFNFEEQASQNLSLFMSDAPNGTVSHTMHSYMMFFPRHYLFHAESEKNEEFKVTLPTGEEMIFNKEGEIIEGVFEEGPVDISGDRFSRHYADLKYQGKGILLRANARGQMPQQGQFESTKIDNEYGIRYSADVLIINGSTGQRCRRPKADFWPSEDVSPILFKFPTDGEFNSYLEAKCGFSIPKLEKNERRKLKTSIMSKKSEVLHHCEASSEYEKCIWNSVDDIKDEDIKARSRFELVPFVLSEKKKEGSVIDKLILQDFQRIQDKLLRDVTWIKDENDLSGLKEACNIKSKSLVSLNFKYHDAVMLMTPSLKSNCFEIKKQIDDLASAELLKVQPMLENDFSWIQAKDVNQFGPICLKTVESLINDEFKFSQRRALYSFSISNVCKLIEEGPSFQNWLQTQASGLIAQLTQSVLRSVEMKGEQKAQDCLKQIPAITVVDKIKYKKDREACLINQWDVIEKISLEDARNNPLARRLNLDLSSVASEMDKNRRLIQLKIMKKYFL